MFTQIYSYKFFILQFLFLRIFFYLPRFFIFRNFYFYEILFLQKYDFAFVLKCSWVYTIWITSQIILTTILDAFSFLRTLLLWGFFFNLFFIFVEIHVLCVCKMNQMLLNWFCDHQHWLPLRTEKYQKKTPHDQI